MEKYSEYRDSGIDWIGAIPSNWKKLRNKNCLACQKEIVGYESNTAQLLSLTTHGVIEKDPDEMMGKVPTTFDTYQKVKPNQIVICLFDLDVSAVFSGISNYYGMISPAYKVFSCEKYITPRYADYWFAYIFEGRKFKQYSKNLRFTLSHDDFALLPIIVPPLEEQKKIVTYLDRKCKSIDDLIDKLVAQLDMFKKYRCDLVGQCIIKGLDKTARLKDSGIDWIGQIPEHWSVTKAKWLFEIVKRIYGAEDRDVLSITQNGIKIKDTTANEGQLAESYANYQVVNVNDFAMNSMDLLTGWVDCSPYEGVTSPDYRVFRFHPDKPQCHTYYKYLFQMCYTNRIFYRLGQGVSNLGRWRLQAGQFLNIRLPQPPIEEQEQIASYLDKKVGQIEELTADIKAQIEKLKEYRKIVIHDAVTGKIKVTEGE